MTAVALSPAALAGLDPAVARPRYDRASLAPAIVHLGVGGFHRAHQAAYIDDLANQGSTWGICGVGVLPHDRPMADALTSQDCLYTLVTKGSGQSRARVIGSIVDYLFAPDNPAAVLDRLAAPTTRIVSLTITEGGYNIDRATHRFDTANEAVVSDAGRAAPRTVFGFVVGALARRRAAGLAPFTVASCDNIPGNGDVARGSMAAFAALTDPGLAAWIEESVDFPNSMVDRITPVTTDKDREDVAASFGIRDAWPVVSEPYRAWAIEDRFGQGRPALEDAGALVVPDVTPYELMKLRLLNGSHQAIAYFGRLLGLTYADEAASDADLAAFTRAYMASEARPTLPPVPGVDLPSYEAELLDRFANPAIGDTLARLSEYTTDRIPAWVVPVAEANLASGGQIEHCAAMIASWTRYCEGVDETGAPITVVDRRRDERMAVAQASRSDPLAFIRDRELFGRLAESERFARAYTRSLESLRRLGARATLADVASRAS